MPLARVGGRTKIGGRPNPVFAVSSAVNQSWASITKTPITGLSRDAIFRQAGCAKVPPQASRIRLILLPVAKPKGQCF